LKSGEALGCKAWALTGKRCSLEWPGQIKKTVRAAKKVSNKFIFNYIKWAIIHVEQEATMGQGQLTFQLNMPVTEFLSRIQKLAEEYGGEFQGDEKSGRVSLDFILGSIKGDYIVDGQQLHLNITKKPFLVSYETIKSTIKDYITGLA